MADKDPKTRITRITATETVEETADGRTAALEIKTTASRDKPAKTRKPARNRRKNPLAAIGAYFKGAWYELRQVRWPTRQATWSLTLAVILFSLFFVVLILLLDALFGYLFELIIR